MNAPQKISTLDALPPVSMAKKAESIGKVKAELDFWSTLVLSVLAGAFIAWGGVFYTTVITNGDAVPLGISRLVGGISFSLGLVLVIVAGAELFTGNNLIVMAWASKRISLFQLLRNWTIVFTGNFIGSIGTAMIVVLSGYASRNSGQFGDTMFRIAQAKCETPWNEAFFAGIACNTLVCLAVWLCLSARTTTDKILAIIFPISAFVATGMEHCVANMYFVPAGWFVARGRGLYESIDLFDFVQNLLAVTTGNIIGGTVLVGLVYWFVYLRPMKASDG